jgi:hypothetical protein
MYFGNGTIGGKKEGEEGRQVERQPDTDKR